MITNEQVESLINISKRLLHKEIINFPKVDDDLSLNAKSVDERYDFRIIINRKIVRPDNPDLKLSLVALYENLRLIGICVSGNNHRNPNGAISKYPNLQENVPCPHFHIYDEEFNNIAFPLPEIIDVGKINDVNDLLDIFIKFLEYFKINNIPMVQPVLN